MELRHCDKDEPNQFEAVFGIGEGPSIGSVTIAVDVHCIDRKSSYSKLAHLAAKGEHVLVALNRDTNEDWCTANLLLRPDAGCAEYFVSMSGTTCTKFTVAREDALELLRFAARVEERLGFDKIANRAVPHDMRFDEIRQRWVME